MIRYALRCNADHRFEAWFASSGDFDRLKAGGHVTCAVCGSGGVEKDLMTPSVASGDGRPQPDPAARERALPDPAPRERALPDLFAPASPAEQALAELRRRIEKEAEHVGPDFAREARRIHAGEAENRPIWGEARPQEAKALLEDGVPVAPLPIVPRKAN